MKALQLLTLSLFIHLPLVVHAEVKPLIQKLALSEKAGCVISDEDVRCWGSSVHYNPKNLGLKLNRPTQVVLAETHACVLDLGEVKCWDKDSLSLFHPNLRIKNAVRLFSNERDDTIYARDEEGLKIVAVLDMEQERKNGRETADKAYFRELPTELIQAKGYGGCFYTSSEILCKDRHSYSNEVEVTDSGFKDIWHRDAGGYMTCTQHGQGYECFGAPGYIDQTWTNEFTITGTIAVGLRHACAITNNEVKCWGQPWNRFTLNVPTNLNNPLEIQARGNDTCVLDAEGVKCWGPTWPLDPWTSTLKDVQSLLRNSHTGEVQDNICTKMPGSLKCLPISSYDWGYRRDAFPIERYQSDSLSGSTNNSQLKTMVEFKSSHLVSCEQDESSFSCSAWNNVNVDTKLNNPSQFGVGINHVCAIEKGKLFCWGGENKFGQTTIPKDIKGVTELAVGKNHNCVLMKNKVRCWGDNSLKQLEHPTDLKSPTLLRSANDRTCLFDQGKVKCWGYESPSSVNYFRDTADGSKVGYSRSFNQYNIPQPTLKNPKEIYVGSDYTCVLDEEGAKCWGRAPFLHWFGRTQKLFKNIKSMVFGDNFICVLSENIEESNQVNCLPGVNWYHDEEKFQIGLFHFQKANESSWENLGRGNFSLTNLEASLSQVGKTMPAFRAWFMENLSKFISKELKNCFLSEYEVKTREECRSNFKSPRGYSVMAARVLMLKLIAPLVESTDTAHFNRVVIPDYQLALRSVEAKLNKEGIDFGDKAQSKLEVRAALKTLELALRASVKALRSGDQKKAMDIAKLAAIQGLNPSSQGLDSLLKSYQQSRGTFKTLENSPKTGFLFQLMEGAVSALP